VKAFSKLVRRELACSEDAEQSLEASTLTEKPTTAPPRYTLEESSLAGGQGNRFKETDGEWLLDGRPMPSAERKIRLLKRKDFFIVVTAELDDRDLAVPHQKGNPTQRPTARWAF